MLKPDTFSTVLGLHCMPHASSAQSTVWRCSVQRVAHGLIACCHTSSSTTWRHSELPNVSS